MKNNKKTDLKNIIHYFKELQQQELDKNDGDIVYRGLATLTPKLLTLKKAHLTNMDKIHVDILSLQSDRAHEIKYVKDIIHHLDHPDDSLVVTASYKYLTQLLINSDLQFFSDESKQLLKNHLGNKNLMNHPQSMLYTAAYEEFKTALSAQNMEEIPILEDE